MEPADRKTLIVVSTALVAITGGVMYGVFGVEREPDTEDPRRFTVQWPDGGVPDGGDVRCVWTTALVTPEMLAVYGARSDAGSQYVYARICEEMPADGGPSEEDEMPLMPGVEAIEYEQNMETYDGGPWFTAILAGQPGWPCACSLGDSCEWSPWYLGGDWEEAPINTTLTAGKWRGPGCHPKSCVELSGSVSSWPAECPTQ